MLEGYKSNNNVVYSSKYHVIWRPKYRRNVLDPPIAKRLQEVLRAACKRSRADIIAQEIMPDHVHLLVEVDRQFGIHRLVKNLKGFSFASLRSRLPTLWTNSSMFRQSEVSVIKQYVENQKNV